MPRLEYILDTNVLLHDPQALFLFGEDMVSIPIEVIEELEEFKHDVTERGRNARAVVKMLDGLRAKGHLGRGIELDNGGTLQVISARQVGPHSPGTGPGGNRVADAILSAALTRRKEEGRECVVVTKNVNLRLKADALGLPARDHDTGRFPDAGLDPGWALLKVSHRVGEDIGRGKTVRLRGVPLLPNQYLLLQVGDDRKGAKLARVGSDGETAMPLRLRDDDTVGIRSLNMEQTFLLDALLDDDIGLVTVTGKAGTGKTLLAVAAGLHKVFAESQYNRLLVFRPTLPISRDLGYLPGDVAEKMRPWMQPVYDALELLRDQDRLSANRTLPPDVLDCEEISIEPMTYIRGRSIPHHFVIIDEAQNLTPLEVKTVITRVGKGTKIVLTGDPQQIDNPYVDSFSNGLTFLVDRFRGNPLSAHVGLVKGERSQLAETAANLL